MTTIHYFCDCGECYTGLVAAIRCKKCVRYLMDDHYPRRSVVVETAHRAPVTIWEAHVPDEENQRRYRRYIYGDD